MRNTQPARSRGFTLLELLVVVAILAVLAGMIIPQFEGTTERTQAATAANNLSDITRKVGEYKALNGTYPDGWDTLITTTTTTTGEGEEETSNTTGALFSSLSPNLRGTTGLLVATSVTTTTATAFKLAGINHVMYHVSASNGQLPSDTGSVSGHLLDHSGNASGVSLAMLNVGTTTSPGIAYNLVANDFNLLGKKDMTSSSGDAFIDTHNFVALGVGPKHWMVSENLVTAPLLTVHDVGRYYSRPLAIFAVHKTNALEKAKFIGMIGPDGYSSAGYLSGYYQQTARDH